ncbi:MAG: XdhC family protein [Bacteroidota bacterium]
MKEIRKIIHTYDQIDHTQEKIALASVVNVEESSYRRIGARMLVRSSGLWVGGISGGCLEGDALKRSQIDIFKDKPSKIVYDTMEDDQNQIGVGLGCNGRIEVLFTPIDPQDANNEIEQLRKISQAGAPAILLKVIDAEDSALLGQQYLLEESSINENFAGIDAVRLNEFIGITRDKRKPKIFPTEVEGKFVKLLVEFIRPETRLIIVGDNYDILAMLGIANELGWECDVVGKAKKLSKQVYKLAKNVVDYAQADELKVNDYTAVMLMSHDYNWDMKMLPVFARKNPAYMGMLGPKKRLQKMNRDLEGIDIENLPFLYSPTGLEIGAESPNEIALSIASEIVAVMRDKPGGFLREKEGTIHEREHITAL